ncbi:hydrogenase expression/formation protein HypE [Ferrimonas balearica]|uniref:hydrogenase expression/formation protein HypE n=1 Tax=Ferrimonas balearica TaxID=44012 RepID=UPI001C99BDA8|nr:hydrogenase expression/formation protein HypE [Ferrimonas balearica]MBY5992411.1 hydrogenase expression/formation protein HypE [Ferrimonas balearica]
MTERITLAHGSGGQAMQRLIRELFLAQFDSAELALMEDQAQLPLAPMTAQGDRLAFATDSFVVDPIEFPGGDIGKLAVCGTVNDLAVGGALPHSLSVGFILEEGLPLEQLERLVRSMADTARAAGVRIVTGDTKVVHKGSCDKIFINTAGVGVIPAERQLGARQVRPGDKILVNGTLGDHGAAILQARGELALSGTLESDCQPLNSLIESMLAAGPIHAMRDATRGGVAAVCNEIAEVANARLQLKETALPIHPEVRGISEILGLDPLLMANEGKLVAFVPAEHADAVLTAMRAHPSGQEAAIIGDVSAADSPQVLVEGLYGTCRQLLMPVGEQLPRIC